MTQTVLDFEWQHERNRRVDSARDRLQDSDSIAVLKVIAGRQEAVAAIQISEIESFTPLPPRKIKAIVKMLVEEYGVPIGASRRPPYGYYMISSHSEAEATAKVYMAEAFSMLRRAKAIRGSEYVKELLGQLKL